MSHSRKDGRRGGAHRNVQGKEYWSKRCDGERSMMDPGREAKTLTHRFERRAARRAVRVELSTARSSDTASLEISEVPARSEGEAP